MCVSVCVCASVSVCVCLHVYIYFHIIYIIYISCMGVYLYIHNKYTQYTHIYCVNKNFYLDVINQINCLTALFFFNKFLALIKTAFI